MQFLLIIPVFFGLLIITRLICLIIHEYGHALIGLLFFRGKLSVFIGSYGDTRKGMFFKIGRLNTHVKYNPFLWNYGLCVAEQQESTILKNFLFTLGGPLASLLTAIGCIYGLLFPEVHGVIKLIALFLFLISSMDFLNTIIPNERPIVLFDGTTTFNDGKTLSDLLRKQRVHKHLTALHTFYTNNQICEGIAYFNNLYSDKTVIDLVRIGIALYTKQGEHTKVLELCQGLKDNQALTSDDYCNYGLAYSYTDDHEKALQLYNQSINLDGQHFYSILNRGYTLNVLEKYEEALIDFNNAIEVNPLYSYAFSNRGLSNLKLGREKQGLEDIEKAIELDENDAYAYKNFGIYHLERGNLNQAEVYFTKAALLDTQTHGLTELIEKVKSKKVLVNNPSG
jgi:Tfp pilus assembly protein PilF